MSAAILQSASAVCTFILLPVAAMSVSPRSMPYVLLLLSLRFWYETGHKGSIYAFTGTHL